MASKVSGVIEKINISGTSHAIASTAYGYCETAAGTAIKNVDMTGFKLEEGMTVHIKFANANSAANPKLKFNSEADENAKPIVQYGTTAAGTTSETNGWYAGAVITLTYDGTSWVRDQGFNTNSTYSYMRPYGSTASATAEKTGTAGWKFQLTAGKYFMFTQYYDNTAQSALTLNIGSTGAKPIYINGQPSSSTNYTLPGGQYLVYYDGTNYHFRTDDKMPGNIAGDAATVNGLTVQTAVPQNAVFTDTNKYHKTGSWNGLTYTATAVNSADELKFTIPNKIQTNWELNATSGNSPSLLFTRDGSLTDWKILVTGGKLSFQSATDASTWTERAYFKDNSGDFVATSFTGKGSDLTNLNASNISSGTLSADRLATSGATAGSYGPSAAVSGTNGTTMNVPYITVDNKGRVTSISNKVYTAVNTWRGIQDNLTSSTNTTESLSAKQGYLLANGSARDSTKLPLSGGTMTGSVTFVGNQSSAWNDKGILFTNGSRIGENSSKALGLYSGSTFYIRPDSATSSSGKGIEISSTSLIPSVTAEMSLGDSSHKWTTVYAANFSGLASKATADASGNTITTTYAPLASPALTGTPTAPTAANGTNTTQIATTAFVNNTLAYADAMIFKGTLGTGGTITALPATHNAGWTYRVITADTYAGKYCEVGTLIICVKDGTAAADADWTSVETNEDGAVIGPSSSTGNNITTFSGATGRIIQDSGKAFSTSTPSSSSTDTQIPTAKAVWAAIDALDGNLNSTTAGSGKTVTEFSQTNGKVSIKFGNISITKSQISDFPKRAGSDSDGGPANTVKGAYTANGGKQNPNYFGTNKVGFLMMNTTVNSNSEYKDWIIMDCYSGNDVGGGVALGVNRQRLGAYIMRSAAARETWAESAELLGTHNYNLYSLPLTGGRVTGDITLYTSGTGSTPALAFQREDTIGGSYYDWRVLNTGGKLTFQDIGSHTSNAWTTRFEMYTDTLTGKFSGPLTGNVSSASGTTLTVSSSSTLFLNSAASTSIIFTKSGADTSHELARFDTSGHFVPKASSSYTIGTSSNKWTAVYATTFYGALDIGTGTENKSRPVWFSYCSSGTITPGKPSKNDNFTYNPSTATLSINNGTTTGTLTATNYSGKAATAGTADISSTVTVTTHTNTTNGNKTYYLPFLTATSGNLSPHAHSAIYLYETVSSGAISKYDFCFGASAIQGSITLWDGSSHWGNIRTVNLSANRTYDLPDTSGTIALTSSNITGNAATATSISTAGGTSAKFWRGDNSWSNTIKQTTNAVLGIDANLKIGTARKDLNFDIAIGSGSGINDGYASGITWGNTDSAYAGIYYQDSHQYGSRLLLGTTNSHANGVYARMLITHDGKVGIGTLSPDKSLTVNGEIKGTALYLKTAASDPSLSAGARIEFSYTDGQPVVLSYTPNDSYRAPAGLKILGGSSATPAWFEVEGGIYTNSYYHIDANRIDNGNWLTGATGKAPTATTTDGNTTYSGAVIGTSILTLGNNKVGANSASGVNNNAQGYLRLYSNGSGYAQLTSYNGDKTRLYPEEGIAIPRDKIGIMFRPDGSSYYTHISYQTTGNEALVSATQYSVTSFIFVNGESYANVASDRWTKLDGSGASGKGPAPGLQIKQNCVSIGELIPSGTNATYKLNVKGSTNLNGLVTVPHTASASDGVRITYSTTIDFFMGVGTANENHGIYDNKAGKWILLASTANTWSFDGNASTATTATKANKANLTTTQYAIARYSATDGTFANSTTTIDDTGNVTVKGKLRVNPSYDTSNSYNEGIRINQASNGWANIHFGGAKDTTSGNAAEAWLVGRRGAAGTYGAVGDFTIEENGSSGLGLTLHKSCGGATFYTSRTGSQTAFKIINAGTVAATTWFYGLEILSASMAANSNASISIGQAASNKNRAYIGFHYAGSGSDSNYLTLGLYGLNDAFYLMGNGRIGLGTSSPSYRLSVNGDVSATNFRGALIGNADSATKITAKLAATTKTFLLGTSTTITGTAANVDLIGDTGVYLTTTAGEISALRYSIHDTTATPVEKAHLEWNATDQSIDFIFA